jgi:predicted aspartyl protease
MLEPVALRDLGTETRDGKRWRVMRVEYPEGDAFDLFLDARDGACTWARATEGDESHWVRFSDWRWVEGVRRPFKLRGVYPDPKQDWSLHWSSATANQGLSAAGFDRPLPIVRIAGDAESTGWLPLSLFDGFHMLVRGTVAGRPSDIMLDSGAELTILSQAFAKQLGLKPAGRVRLVGAVNVQRASWVRGVDVRIGPLSLIDPAVAVTDLREVEKDVGRSMPATVGRELWNGAVVDIDYPDTRIAFHDPARYQPDPDARRIPLVAGDNGDMLIEASVEGLPPALFRIDTGSSGAVALFGSYVDANGLLQNRSPLGRRLSSGIGGSRDVTVATLNSFSIGGFELHGVPAEFHDTKEGTFSARHIAGNIGAKILQRFRVTFDRANGGMYLTPGAGWDSVPF